MRLEAKKTCLRARGFPKDTLFPINCILQTRIRPKDSHFLKVNVTRRREDQKSDQKLSRVIDPSTEQL